MNLINKRNFTIAALTFVAGMTLAVIFARGVAFGGLQNVFTRDTTTKGPIAAYILDDAGAVSGLVLANGDQLRFGRNLGESLAASVKLGDEVTAMGDAGTRASAGREVRVKQLTVNGRTFIAAGPEHEPKHGPGRPHGPQPPPAAPGTTESPAANVSQPAISAPPTPPAPEMISGATFVPQMTATGTVRTYLVGRHGEAKGAILTSGEQFHLAPQTGELLMAALGGTLKTDVPVSVEGSAVQTERGTVIRLRRLSIGNQTFALGR